MVARYVKKTSLKKGFCTPQNRKSKSLTSKGILTLLMLKKYILNY